MHFLPIAFDLSRVDTRCRMSCRPVLVLSTWLLAGCGPTDTEFLDSWADILCNPPGTCADRSDFYGAQCLTIHLSVRDYWLQSVQEEANGACEFRPQAAQTCLAAMQTAWADDCSADMQALLEPCAFSAVWTCDVEGLAGPLPAL